MYENGEQINLFFSYGNNQRDNFFVAQQVLLWKSLASELSMPTACSPHFWEKKKKHKPNYVCIKAWIGGEKIKSSVLKK